MLNALFTRPKAKKQSLQAQLAEKEAEVAFLKGKLADRNRYISELNLANRKLIIENGELRAAYNGLKEILRKRADPEAVAADIEAEKALAAEMAASERRRPPSAFTRRCVEDLEAISEQEIAEAVEESMKEPFRYRIEAEQERQAVAEIEAALDRQYALEQAAEQRSKAVSGAEQ